MSTLKIINLQHPSNANNNVVLDANGNMTCTGTVVGGSSMGMRNRVINGDMSIDQRNGGSSTTPTSNQYCIDRWMCALTQASKYSAQQNAGSVTPPAGFINYLGVTSLSSYSVVSGDFFGLQHRIEGYNCFDLAYGSSSAKTVTLSFWVRASITGGYSIQIYNPASTTRSYLAGYNIISANTWEYKTVVIPGDAAQSLASVTNSLAILINFSFGMGSTYTSASAGWQNGNYGALSGYNTSIVGTNGATFYVTGVQLEIGTTATPFEKRQYTTELELCQRYYLKQWSTLSFGRGSNELMFQFLPKVDMRTVPTAISLRSTWYYESSVWATAGTITSVSIDLAHISYRGGDVKIAGTFSPTTSYGSMVLLGDDNIAFTSEL